MLNTLILIGLMLLPLVCVYFVGKIYENKASPYAIYTVSDEDAQWLLDTLDGAHTITITKGVGVSYNVPEHILSSLQAIITAHKQAMAKANMPETP